MIIQEFRLLTAISLSLIHCAIFNFFYSLDESIAIMNLYPDTRNLFGWRFSSDFVKIWTLWVISSVTRHNNRLLLSVTFQPRDLRALKVALARAPWYSVVVRSCRAIKTVHWEYKRWTRHGWSRPTCLSLPVTPVSWCWQLRRTLDPDSTRGGSTSSTSETVWPESIRWLWRAVFVSSLQSLLRFMQCRV